MGFTHLDKALVLLSLSFDFSSSLLCLSLWTCPPCQPLHSHSLHPSFPMFALHFYPPVKHLETSFADFIDLPLSLSWNTNVLHPPNLNGKRRYHRGKQPLHVTVLPLCDWQQIYVFLDFSAAFDYWNPSLNKSFVSHWLYSSKSFCPPPLYIFSPD